MHDVLQQLRNEYEFIFIDSSPVMAVSDALVLSTKIDGALLVINSETSKSMLFLHVRLHLLPATRR
jgi:succinoglycan biosynthesis transport protein ExoP